MIPTKQLVDESLEIAEKGFYIKDGDKRVELPYTPSELKEYEVVVKPPTLERGDGRIRLMVVSSYIEPIGDCTPLFICFTDTKVDSVNCIRNTTIGTILQDERIMKVLRVPNPPSLYAPHVCLLRTNEGVLLPEALKISTLVTKRPSCVEDVMGLLSVAKEHGHSKILMPLLPHGLTRAVDSFAYIQSFGGINSDIDVYIVDRMTDLKRETRWGMERAKRPQNPPKQESLFEKIIKRIKKC